VPYGGWQRFNRYVNNKVESFKDSLTRDEDFFNADVVLEFDIDKKGRPTNIEIANAETQKANTKKAIEILEKGPKWKRLLKNQKAKVKIPFAQ
jgi:hypothetical protein